MAKEKDFYGNSVTEVIAQACKELSVSQEELDIDVIETGSAGIFGLCRKKAHIRVTRKVNKKKTSAKKAARPRNEEKKIKKSSSAQPVLKEEVKEKGQVELEQADQGDSAGEKVPSELTDKPSTTVTGKPDEKAVIELPSDEVLAHIKEDIAGLLNVMELPSEITVKVVDNIVACQISGEHEDILIGEEGRTLDSLQYLLRKMMSRRLPDRIMLSLDVGNYRQQRSKLLKEKALSLAEQVKENGKTQAIAGLNPSERRVVHMALQEDKGIRSRSVGDGLFKKVLIYKPGKKKKAGPRKGKAQKSGQSSDKK